MSPARGLPPAEKIALRLGFMRLTDSAPVIVAQEQGLYRKYGLEVELLREVSWANLRDRLVMGDLDGAQLLAPLPMMTSYGAGGIRANLLTGLSLCLNGNAITLGNVLYENLQPAPDDTPLDAVQTSKRLRTLLTTATRKPTLTFATVHLFSMHTLQLRAWLQAGGIDPDTDVRIIVLPPEQMCDSLARGVIDGFCVGEPWNSLAVSQGIGSVVSSGYAIWNNAPEKVLAVTEDWHGAQPGSHLRLRLALMEAAQYLMEPANRIAAAAVLSRAEYLNLPEKLLLPSLTGEFQFSKNLAAASVPDFHVFGRYHAGFPWRSQAQWMVQQCASMLSRPLAPEQIHNLVQRAYRTDLYREAARYLDLPAPSQDYKVENQHDSTWELEPGITLGADRQIFTT